MILGLSFSHNASACLLCESGEVLAAVSEERFTRRKNETGIPVNAIRSILGHHDSARIRLVAVGELCESRWASRTLAEALYLEPQAVRDALVRNKLRFGLAGATELIGSAFRRKDDYRDLVERRLRQLGLTQPMTYIEHHVAHAASAYFAGPGGPALTATLDGEGDRKSGGIWDCVGGTMTRICDVAETQSIGKFYRAITSLLGFRINRHEGKVTGLAAFGNPERFREVMHSLLHIEAGPTGPAIRSAIAESLLSELSFRSVDPLRLMRFTDLALGARSWEDLNSEMLHRHFRRTIGSRLDLDWRNLSFEDQADLAAAVQEQLDAVVLEWIEPYLERTGRRRLVLAGGVFANVKLNQRLLERLPVDEIFIQPGMGDEGLAIGAAMQALRENAETAPGPVAMRHADLGPAIEPAEVDDALTSIGLAHDTLEIDQLAEAVVEALVDHKVVGLVHGSMEFGPRALGQRSLLAHPGRKSINETLNRRLRRTEFMPFAPVVLESMFDEIFDGPKLGGARLAARFMTITLTVKPEWRDRLAGVVHVDGTARPQIIDGQSDPLYRSIVELFHARTGLGCLVNTSFNLHEEPIIADLEDALRALEQGAADILVIGHSLVRRNGIKSSET